MKVQTMPVITVYDLADALEAQYNWGLNSSDISQLMFGEEYMNDCYKRYYFAEDAICWSVKYEEAVRKENLLKSFLRDTFPEYSEILVDVYW